jgi:transposase
MRRVAACRVTITREEYGAADLRQKAARTRNADAAHAGPGVGARGQEPTEVVQTCGMDHQTLRDWVHRYNANRLAGLSNRPHPGRPPRLSSEQMRELEALVETSSDPQTDGVVRWRRMDLVSLIANHFHVRLHKLDFAKLSVRPQAGPVLSVPI